MSNGSFSSMVSSVMSICRIKPLIPAFSLMEMMVVMLVVAVIMALAAPMITKKSGGAGAGSGCLWTSIPGGHIGYNAPSSTGAAESGRSVVVGTNQNSISGMTGYVATLQGVSGDAYSPRLILNALSQGGAGAVVPAIGFMHDGNPIGVMHIGSGNKMFIGHNAVVNGADSDINSIAIGYETKINEKNIIAIGTDIVTANSNTVAIGSNMKNTTAPAGESVAIGIDASTGSGGSVAIGYKTSAKDNGIAIGKGSDTKALETNGGVIIGDPNTEATGESVAIGKGTKAKGDKSTAVGISAQATDANGVAIGHNAQATSGVAVGSNGTKASKGVAVGNKATAETGVAVGNNATATSGLAIGTNATSNSNCDAIGTDAYCSDANSIVIGANGKTVIINASQIKFNATNGIEIKNTGAASTPLTLESNSIEFNTSSNVQIVGAGLDMDGNAIVGANLDVTGGISAGGNVSDRYDSISELAQAIAILKNQYSSLSQVSDKRLKDIIGENLDAMDKINQLKVYNFTFKDDEDKSPRVGVMAQDLQKVFPNAVVKGEDGYLRIRHEDMFYSMINALKELDAKIKAIATQIAENIKVVAEQKAEIKALKAKVDKQDKEIEELRAEIKDLKKIVNKLAK